MGMDCRMWRRKAGETGRRWVGGEWEKWTIEGGACAGWAGDQIGRGSEGGPGARARVAGYQQVSTISTLEGILDLEMGDLASNDFRI